MVFELEYTLSQTHLQFIKLKQRKSQPGMRFGYPVLINIDLTRIYFSVYSLVFLDWEDITLSNYLNLFWISDTTVKKDVNRIQLKVREVIDQTLETVFHRLSKHLEIRQKYPRCTSYFQFSSWCLDTRWSTVSLVWSITSRTFSCMQFTFFLTVVSDIQYKLF